MTDASGRGGAGRAPLRPGWSASFIGARDSTSRGQNLAAILALKDYIYIKRVKSNISNCLLLGALELASALAAAAAACSVCDAAYPSCDVDIFEFAIFTILPFFLIALNLMINHSDQKFKLNINKSEKKHQSKCAPEINQIQPIKSQHLLKSTQFNHYKLKFKTISRGFGVNLF